MTSPHSFSLTSLRLLLATSNKGKIEELRRQLVRCALEVEILTPSVFGPLPTPEETGETFAENARQKACYYADLTGVVALADDSGLEVDALHGRPGVHSARYGETAQQGIERLLSELSAVPHAQRTARFRCAMALAIPGEGVFAESDGAVEGMISTARRGQGGFGYDPVFIVAGNPSERHMAELSLEEKQTISHRGLALRSILPAIIGLFTP
jgi:XTP/dITP diphosphohydrolase